MKFLALKYFLEVANELSFTRAAESLYISQQALSQHIKQLEEYYQVKLFQRKPTLKLTYAGEKLLTYAKMVSMAEERLKADLSFIRKNEKGKVVLGITSSRSPLFIPKLVTKFKQKYPNIDLSLKESNTASLEEFVLNGEIDVMVGIITNYAHYKNSEFKITELLEETTYLIVEDQLLEQYCPELYPHRKIATKQGIMLKDFLQLPVIIHPSESRVHTEILQYYREHKVIPNVLIESNNGLSLFPLCEQGLGAIFLSHMALCHLLNQYTNLRNSLNILPITDCLCECKIVLMYHKDKPMSKYLLDLIKMTQEVFMTFKFVNI